MKKVKFVMVVFTAMFCFGNSSKASIKAYFAPQNHYDWLHTNNIDSIICVNDSLYMSDGSSSFGENVADWFWYVGADGTVPKFYYQDQNVPPITFSKSGIYSVKLVVKGTGGGIDSMTRRIYVYDYPTANAGADKTVCKGGMAKLVASGGTSYKWSTTATTSAISVKVDFPPSATYTVVVLVDSTGCSSTDTVSVSSYIPKVSLNTLPSLVGNNDSIISLSGVPSGGFFSGKGVKGNKFIPQNAGLGKKTIYYVYTDSAKCSNTATGSLVVYDTTGVVCTKYDTIRKMVTDTIRKIIYDTIHVTINDTAHVRVTDTLVIKVTTGIKPSGVVNIIKMYPNPASDHLVIDFGDYLLMSGYLLKISDMTGRVVFSDLIINQQNIVDLNNWSRGVYTVRIVDGDGKMVSIKKLMVE